MKLWTLVLLFLLAGVRPVLADCGRIPEAGQVQLTALADRYATELRSDDDELRRVWAKRAAEQLATLDPTWGSKRASRDRPPTKDGVAKVVAGILCVWDVVNGATRALQFGEGEPIPDQVFIPVLPIDHLGQVGLPPVPPPPVPGPGEQAALLARLAALEARLDAIALAAQNASNRAEAVVTASIEIRDLLRELERKPWPTYQSHRLPVLGTITLTPR